jgi:DMSO/TMAO reductase YedYZ molybdopterin-dependent catalytic subunit
VAGRQWILARCHVVTLPPGQFEIGEFPRFGTHLHRPPPAVPHDPAITITGAGAKPFDLPLADLATLPRRELTADFHCVAGWSATNLHWEGVAFETFYRTIIVPSLPPDTSVTHLVFGGLDGYRSSVTIEDALAHDVLIADHLDGQPLDGDHGAPARLVSPDQYGFVSTKHLCRVELHTAEPTERRHPSPVIQLGLQLVKPHRRARVWQEERHRYLPRLVSAVRVPAPRSRHSVLQRSRRPARSYRTRVAMTADARHRPRARRGSFAWCPTATSVASSGAR